MVLTAAELHERAVAALVRGRHRVARGLLDRALERVGGDVDLRARVRTSLAYAYALADEVDQARAMCDLADADPAVSPATRGVVAAQRALLLIRSGDATAGLAELDTAISLLRDDAELGKALVNRGNVFLQRGDAAAAARDLAGGVELLERARLSVDAAMTRHNLGYVQLLRGHLVEAMREMDAARVVLEETGPLARAVCDQDRAEVFLAAGLLDEGRAALESAAAAFGTRRMRQPQGEAELALARAVLGVDPSTARDAARRARRHFVLSGGEGWRVRAESVVLAADVELGGAAPRLVATALGLADELDGQGLSWSAAHARLAGARVLLRRGEVERAHTLLGRALQPQAPLAIRLLDRDLRAEVARASGHPGRALQHLRAGLADLHAWQSSFGSLDLQTGVAGHGVRLGMRGLTLAVESRKPEVLFEWSERARMLASRVQPVRAPEDEQIVADLAELREMAAEGAQRDPAREAELRQRIRERAWQHRGSGEVADPVTLQELQGSLDGETALAAYVVTAEHVVALVVTGDAATWVDLGERAELEDLLGGLLPDLDVAAADLPDAMAGFVRTALAERLATLGELLVAPVLDAVGERRVVLTPSGVLAGVPWTLLPGFTGRPVTVAQSATSWLARRTTPRRSATAGFVAGPRVARAEDEVTAAAKEWPSAQALSGEAAHAAAVSELAASVDVLHVAAHGRHSAENPLFSGLQLVDGPWFGYDIDRLRVVPDVVILSACEVGRSTVRAGEELIGMATAWLHAGARCVVASAAAVNDQAAYDVLVAVHQQLAAGIDPAVALAAAVPAVAADTAPVPLVCFG